MSDDDQHTREGEDSDLSAAEIEQAIREADDEEAAMEAMVSGRLCPLYWRGGLEAIQSIIDGRRSSRVAWALERLCGRAGINPLVVFADDELVAQAARYLRSLPDRSKSEGWAYAALWSRDLSADERFDLIMKVTEAVGDNDTALWMIGDGPIGELQMQEGGPERLEAAARENGRLRRALDLIQQIP